MKEIKIVTAFFDIGRANSDIFPRSNDQYFTYFDFWARIQNDLTVYCEPEYYERIYEIRKKYNLEKRTHIISIVDVYNIEPQMFECMSNIEKNNSFKDFRYYNNALSNTAKYDYVMMLKWWFLSDASTRFEEDCMVAWLDFGYNHGGDRYINPEDFNFEWKWNFPEKINAFCLSNPDEMTCIDSLQFQKDCFIGHTLIMPKESTDLFWEKVRAAMNSLISLDCIDDDQQLLLMVYKNNKEWFNITICDWFEDFQLCSKQQFTIKTKEKTCLLNDNVSNGRKCVRARLLFRIIRKIRWCYNRIIDPTYPSADEMHPFVKRIDEKRKKYYG